MGCAITAERLSKTFSVRAQDKGGLSGFLGSSRTSVDAVKGVSFSAEEGEILAILGSSGSGKSTLLKLLSGELGLSSGLARVLDLEPRAQHGELSRCTALVAQGKSRLWPYIPVAESYALIGKLNHIEADDLSWREDDLSRRFGIGAYLGTPASKLPAEIKARCEIAAALIPAPIILFLDEPFMQLAENEKLRISALIAAEAELDGTTVVLASEDPLEAETLGCRRALILEKGQLVFDGRMESALNQRAQTRSAARALPQRAAQTARSQAQPAAAAL